MAAQSVFAAPEVEGAALATEDGPQGGLSEVWVSVGRERQMLRAVPHTCSMHAAGRLALQSRRRSGADSSCSKATRGTAGSGTSR